MTALNSPSPQAWRWQTVTVILPILSLLTLVWVIPDSPYYLVTKGRFRDAYTALRASRGTKLQAACDLIYITNLVRAEVASSPTLSVDQLPERQTVQPTSNKGSSSAPLTSREWLCDSWGCLRRHWTTLRRLVQATLLVMLFQQLCGLNVLSFYSSSFFNSYHEDSSTNTIYICLIACMVSLCSIGTIVLREKPSRYQLRFFSNIMALLLLAIVVYSLRSESDLGWTLSTLVPFLYVALRSTVMGNGECLIDRTRSMLTISSGVVPTPKRCSHFILRRGHGCCVELDWCWIPDLPGNPTLRKCIFLATVKAPLDVSH